MIVGGMVFVIVRTLFEVKKVSTYIMECFSLLWKVQVLLRKIAILD